MNRQQFQFLQLSTTMNPSESRWPASLSRLDMKLRCLRRGVSAIGHHRDSLACLILDVRLPGMSGVELYTQLNQNLKSIPTIIITAHADPELNTWATKTGVIALLYKPFQPE